MTNHLHYSQIDKGPLLGTKADKYRSKNEGVTKEGSMRTAPYNFRTQTLFPRGLRQDNPPSCYPRELASPLWESRHCKFQKELLLSLLTATACINNSFTTFP
jgi:hypothetical protein